MPLKSDLKLSSGKPLPQVRGQFRMTEAQRSLAGSLWNVRSKDPNDRNDIAPHLEAVDLVPDGILLNVAEILVGARWRPNPAQVQFMCSVAWETAIQVADCLQPRRYQKPRIRRERL